jgi:hypothetical protein
MSMPRTGRAAGDIDVAGDVEVGTDDAGDQRQGAVDC